MKKYIFVTVFIGNTNEVHNINANMKKKNDCDYILFTNLKKNQIQTNFWDIITIDISDSAFNNLNRVKISRYFKFNIFNTIQKYLEYKDYKYYIYCDSQYVPNVNEELINIIKKSDESKYGIIQYLHPVNKINLKNEMNLIIKCHKDTKKNIDLTKLFLININRTEFNKIYQKQFYVENSIIIYNLKNNLLNKFLDEFYKLYLLCPTYRDQPLWNFLLQLYNINPIIIPLKKYFTSIKKKDYNTKIYNSKINI